MPKLVAPLDKSCKVAPACEVARPGSRNYRVVCERDGNGRPLVCHEVDPPRRAEENNERDNKSHPHRPLPYAQSFVRMILTPEKAVKAGGQSFFQHTAKEEPLLPSGMCCAEVSDNRSTRATVSLYACLVDKR